MLENDNKILLLDENGKEQEFEVVATLGVEENEYAVLFPVIQEDTSNEDACILRIEYDEDGELILVNIDDTNEFENVVAAYEAIVDEII